MIIPTYITIFLLFLLPLIVIPLGYSYFEVPKVLIAEVLIIITSIYILVKKGDLIKQLDRTFLWVILAIFGLSLIDLLLFRTNITLLGNIYRLQGVFLLWNLLALSLIIAKVVDLTIVVKNLFIIPLWALLVTVFIFGLDERGKYVGSLGDANSLAATAVFIWPFAWFASEYKILKISSLAVAFMIVALSQSRAGIIALMIQLIVFAGLKFLKLSLTKATLIGIVFLLLSLFIPFFDQPNVYENRAEIWKTAVTSPYDQFHDGNLNFVALFLGRGFGNTEKTLPLLSVGLDNNVRFQYVDSAHNIFLDWWIQGGLIGVAILFWLVYSTIRAYVGSANIALLMASLGILTSLLFNPLSVVNLMQFWWLVGTSFKSKNFHLSHSM